MNFGFLNTHLSALVIDDSGTFLCAGTLGNGVYRNSPPGPPILLIDENSGRSAALDSVTFVRDPFAVFNNLNFSLDGRTRLILFAANVDLAAGEPLSVLTVQAEDAQHTIHSLPVEHVAKVRNFDWLSQITVQLPESLDHSGDVNVSITLRGVSSNLVTIKVK